MNLAILDDYQNIALKSADWSSLGNLQIKVFDQAFDSIRSGTTPEGVKRGNTLVHLSGRFSP